MSESENYQSILVGVDGSEKSQYAFKEAIKVSMRNHAKLHVVEVIDTRYSLLPKESYDVLKEESTDRLNALKEQAKNFGFVGDLTFSTEFGSPKELLGNIIPKAEVNDLIILGATGKHVVKGLGIGSVATYVVKNAPCNVLICK